MMTSRAYGRAKLVNGLLFGALGAVIAYRTLVVIGLRPAALPGALLGLAMFGLAVVRLRAWSAARHS